MEQKLNVKIPGVEVLGRNELKKVEGGIIGLLLRVAAAVYTYVVVEAALNPSAHTEAFNEGRQMFNDKFN